MKQEESLLEKIHWYAHNADHALTQGHVKECRALLLKIDMACHDIPNHNWLQRLIKKWFKL